jgi:hypothetical protein
MSATAPTGPRHTDVGHPRRRCRPCLRLGRRLALALVLTAASGNIAMAHAAAWTFGGAGVYRSPTEGRATAIAERDVLDYLGVRIEAAAGASAGRPVGLVWVGPTLGLDVWTWAPTLFAGIGWRSEPGGLTGTVRAEVRRYVSLHGAIGVGVGGEWAANQPIQASALLGYFYRL